MRKKEQEYVQVKFNYDTTVENLFQMQCNYDAKEQECVQVMFNDDVTVW